MSYHFLVAIKVHNFLVPMLVILLTYAILHNNSDIQISLGHYQLITKKYETLPLYSHHSHQYHLVRRKFVPLNKHQQKRAAQSYTHLSTINKNHNALT